jgi:hypothetical protein
LDQIADLNFQFYIQLLQEEILSKIEKIFLKYNINLIFSEILRVIDSLQLCHKHGNKIATPVNWKQGDDVFIHPSVEENVAIENFQRFQTIEVPSGKSYLRKTEQPRNN